MRKKLGLRSRVAGLVALTAAAAAVLLLVVGASATPVTGAVNTTDDPTWNGPNNDGLDASGNTILGAPTQACLNGGSHSDPAVNCNIYQNKTDVFLSGTPNPAALGAGTYFFAVLVPGGQPDPNDGGAKNLSDKNCLPYTSQTSPACGGHNGDGSTIASGDLVTNREFSSDGTGNITPLGSSTHAYDGRVGHQEIQVAPYDDTTNPGGVYILATCKISDSQGFVAFVGTVDPRDCKYDAFKVKVTPPPNGKPPAAELSVSKDANPTFDHEFGWTITKSASSCPVTNPCDASSATVTYTVTVTHDAGQDTNWMVTGTITILNFNDFAVSSVNINDVINKTAEPAGNDPSNIAYDQDANASCSVTDGTGVTVPAYDSGTAMPGSLQRDYSCTWNPSGPASNSEYNTVGIDWPFTAGSDDTADLPAGAADFTLPFTFSDPTLTDNCANVTDTFNGGTADQLGFFCANNNPTATNLGTLPNFHESYTPGSCLGTACGTGAFTFTYTRTIIPDPTSATGCTSFSNSASFADNSGPDVAHGQHVGTAGATVSICGPRFTPGYWKNHLADAVSVHTWSDGSCGTTALKNAGGSCSTLGPFAKQYTNSAHWKCLGAADNCTPPPGYKVDTILNAAKVFNAMNCSNTGSVSQMNQNAIGCLAGHLLSAKYNRNINDSSNCIDATITQADAFLGNTSNTGIRNNGTTNPATYGYIGPAGNYSNITAAQRNTAISLKTALDNYDNGGGC
jgi:hypothetical protein